MAASQPINGLTTSHCRIFEKLVRFPIFPRSWIARLGVTAVALLGSIPSPGSQHAVALDAANFRTGDSLGTETARPANKEDVLKVFDHAGPQLSENVGASSPSVHNYGTPL